MFDPRSVCMRDIDSSTVFVYSFRYVRVVGCECSWKATYFFGKYIAEELLPRIAIFAFPFRRKIIISLCYHIESIPMQKYFHFLPPLFQDKSNIFATQHNSQNLLFLLLNKRFNYPSLRCPFLLIPALLISPKPPYTKCYWKPDWSTVVQINYNYNLKPNKLNSFNAK